ncbi:MAG: magnesium chelatase domain-containing protein, partial [Solirubrobacterales bacterium]
MLATARTFTLDGISARPVRVEVDVHRGLPNFTIVGLPDAAVREARERVRAALVNCGFEFPLRRIVVNLAPASLRKAGPGMDLAIAAALLSASEQLEWKGLARVALVGELALDGSTRSVQGALAMAEAARESEADAIVLP